LHVVHTTDTGAFVNAVSGLPVSDPRLCTFAYVSRRQNPPVEFLKHMESRIGE